MNDLLHTYAYVCNEAMLRNKDRFPFKHILMAAKDAARGRVVEVHVLPLDQRAYILKMDNQSIVADMHEACGTCQCDAHWRVHRSYLEEVAATPDVFIANPAKLDWEWLYDV